MYINSVTTHQVYTYTYTPNGRLVRICLSQYLSLQMTINPSVSTIVEEQRFFLCTTTYNVSYAGVSGVALIL